MVGRGHGEFIKDLLNSMKAVKYFALKRLND